MEWYYVCWPSLTAKSVEPVVSISWASCVICDVNSTCMLLRMQKIRNRKIFAATTAFHWWEHLSWSPCFCQLTSPHSFCTVYTCANDILKVKNCNLECSTNIRIERLFVSFCSYLRVLNCDSIHVQVGNSETILRTKKCLKIDKFAVYFRLSNTDSR